MPQSFSGIILFKPRRTRQGDSVCTATRVLKRSQLFFVLPHHARNPIVELKVKDVTAADDASIVVQTPSESLAKPKDGCCGGGCH